MIIETDYGPVKLEPIIAYRVEAWWPKRSDKRTRDHKDYTAWTRDINAAMRACFRIQANVPTRLTLEGFR